MGSNTSAAGKGLRLVFWGNLLLVASAVLACVAALGPVITVLYVAVDLIGLALSALGLAKAMSVHGGYRTALFFILIVLVCDVLAAITGSWVYLLLRAVSAIVSYMGMAYVCDSTVQLCMGERGMADLEDKARKMYLGCAAVVVFCQLLSVVNALGDMGGFMNLLSRVVQAIGCIYYMYFLHLGSKALAR